MIFHKEMAMVLALILTILSAWSMAFFRDCQKAEESLLRLHILAHSDGEEQQLLKLSVRDRLLKESEQWFSTAADKEAAQEILQNRLSDIAAIADDELRKQGSSLPVKVELCRSHFPQKSYDGFTLPAGEYDALRILIGEGKGQNWWCVLFPALCIPSAAADSEQWFSQQGLSCLQQQSLYEPRFALVEWWQGFMEEKS